MSGGGKNHHYVPQFYLRAFANALNGKSVSSYAIGTSTYTEHSSIKNQASRRKFYGDGILEETMQHLENNAAPIIKRLTAGELPKRATPDHLLLMFFLAVQRSRTPYAVDTLHENDSKMHDLLKAENAKEELLASFLGRSDSDNVCTLLNITANCHVLLYDLAFAILVSTKPGFVTSDSPVVFLNQFYQYKNPLVSNCGYVCRGLQVFFPLSPYRCLIAYDSDIYKVHGKSDKPKEVLICDNDVEQINDLQAISAYQVLYSKSTVSKKYLESLAASL